MTELREGTSGKVVGEAQQDPAQPRDVQGIVDGIVSRYGGNCHNWPEWPDLLLRHGLTPADVDRRMLVIAQKRMAEAVKSDFRSYNARNGFLALEALAPGTEFDLGGRHGRLLDVNNCEAKVSLVGGETVRWSPGTVVRVSGNGHSNEATSEAVPVGTIDADSDISELDNSVLEPSSIEENQVNEPDGEQRHEPSGVTDPVPDERDEAMVTATAAEGMKVELELARAMLVEMGFQAESWSPNKIEKILNRQERLNEAKKTPEGMHRVLFKAVASVLQDGGKVELERGSGSEGNGEVHADNGKAEAEPEKKRRGRSPGSGKKVASKEKEEGVSKLSGLDAAAKVLQQAKKPMNKFDLVAMMESKGYWKSPGGKTPADTIKAAIHTEIRTKGKESRFKKADRGLFAAS